VSLGTKDGDFTTDFPQERLNLPRFENSQGCSSALCLKDAQIRLKVAAPLGAC
jgi:hypothetical protein